MLPNIERCTSSQNINLNGGIVYKIYYYLYASIVSSFI